ncbi:uncharacterized protein [Montipora capricornis]|uniref:uncharacterized protein n=1 Tax=Montipora foliosa TaxID=591990 RepID=UPI0035F14F3C
MDWLDFGTKILSVVAGKMALNALVPGASAIVDFAQAGNDFYQGDLVGGLINVVSGIGDIFTLGASGVVKDAMKESAKKAGVETAKEMAKEAEKEATRKVGQELGKQLAKGMVEKGGKGAAIQAAKAAAYVAGKKATKEVGQQISKEFARGAVKEAVEEAWKEGTKITAKKFVHDSAIKVISTGGREILIALTEDLSHEAIKEGIEGFLRETAKQTGKTVFSFALTGSVATAAASKEFTKNAWKLTGLDYTIAVVKGSINNLK